MYFRGSVLLLLLLGKTILSFGDVQHDYNDGWWCVVAQRPQHSHKAWLTGYHALYMRCAHIVPKVLAGYVLDEDKLRLAGGALFRNGSS